MQKGKESLYNILLISPAFIIYTVLLVLPIIQSVYLSFFEWDGIPSNSMNFVGVDNFITLLFDSHFWESMKNVAILALSNILLLMPLALSLAMIVISNIKLKRFFKASYFMPAVITLTAIGLMWTFILSPEGGLLNAIINKIGLGFLIKDWLGDPNIVIYTIAIINTWIYTGLNMLIFAAALVGIPEELYEASKIDGATGVAAFWHITIPLLKNAFEVFILQALIFTLRSFEVVFVMTQGGPAGSSDLPIVLLYKKAFKFNQFGEANAIGTFILCTSLVIAIVNSKVFNKSKL